MDPYEKLARILFCCDNPPGTEYILILVTDEPIEHAVRVVVRRERD